MRLVARLTSQASFIGLERIKPPSALGRLAGTKAYDSDMNPGILAANLQSLHF